MGTLNLQSNQPTGRVALSPYTPGILISFNFHTHLIVDHYFREKIRVLDYTPEI